MAHTTDVDAMLAAMTPEQFDEWIAYAQTDPWGDDWEQAGSVAAAAHNAGVWSKAAAGAPTEVDEFLTKDHFIPGRTPRKIEPKRVTAAVFEYEMRAMFGAPPT